MTQCNLSVDWCRILVDDKLTKNSADGSLLSCITPDSNTWQQQSVSQCFSFSGYGCGINLVSLLLEVKNNEDINGRSCYTT